MNAIVSKTNYSNREKWTDLQILYKKRHNLLTGAYKQNDTTNEENLALKLNSYQLLQNTYKEDEEEYEYFAQKKRVVLQKLVTFELQTQCISSQLILYDLNSLLSYQSLSKEVRADTEKQKAITQERMDIESEIQALHEKKATNGYKEEQ